MSFASLVEPVPHESRSEEESSEERSDSSRLSRLMRSARGPGSYFSLESGESQFQGSLWRATLSREAWMPIWGLSTESMSPGRLPILVVKAAAEQGDGDGAGEYGCSGDHDCR